MTIRAFLISSVLASLIGLMLLLLTLIHINPYQASIPEFSLFFLSLFITVSGLTSLIGYFIRRLINPKQFPTYPARVALRQGIFVGVLTVVLLLLQLMRLYYWWLAGLIIVFLITFELVWTSHDTSQRRTTKAATS